MNGLYPIGDVSAIRFYADEGIVAWSKTSRGMAAGSAGFAAASTGEHDLRYSTLVATINGTPKPDPDRTAAVQEWLATVLREGGSR
ncbi:hypothetical protein [Amycolatopsis sacchari]|uniref:hypothetical protein n=1 Tax=Amycolatopsis sacchari TaxID=115433 RepID=UPI003D714122